MFYPFPIDKKTECIIYCSRHAEPAADLNNTAFIFLTWIFCGCRRVRVWSPWTETLQFLLNFHSADMISWKPWPLVVIRQGSWVAIHKSLRAGWPYFLLAVQRSCPPYEKAFHHKQLHLNHGYKYFTEAERSGGDASDKTLNHVPLHLSYPSLQSVSMLPQRAFQALLQNIRFFSKMQIINSLSCCLANHYVSSSSCFPV